MGSSSKWKKLIQDTDTISYIKDGTDIRVIIEARQYDDGWEIVKKYIGGGVNFVETYSAQTSSELRRLLKQLRAERDLSKNEIRDITNFRKKSLKVLVKRGWKENGVEKWFFSINDDFNNFITVRYGKEIDVDIVMEEQLKYIEEKLTQRLFDVLGLQEVDLAINQHIYYYSKKATYYIEQENLDVDFQFLFE